MGSLFRILLLLLRLSSTASPLTPPANAAAALWDGWHRWAVLVSSPGIGFGEQGDDYVRIALVENEHRIRQAARNLKRFLSTADETMHNVISLNAHRS